MLIIGERLPHEIIELIKNSSTASERRLICDKHNLSIDLMNSLLRRDRNVTAGNEMLIKDVINKCEKNIRNNLKMLEKI